MLHLARKVAGITIRGTDGDIGTLEDFYFEESGWNVRYLLVDTHDGRRVLLPPTAVKGAWGRSGMRVNLGREELRNDTALDESAVASAEERLDSIRKTSGYHIRARNGEIGHVDDFLIGQDSWRIRYLLVDTSNWIGGRSVIVSSDVVERVDQAGGEIHVAADRDAIANAPALETIEQVLSLSETGPPFTII